jgi:glycine betaine/proline transport system permease protein
MTAVTLVGTRREIRQIGRGWVVLGIFAAWVVLWIPLHGRHTLSLAAAELTPLHDRLNEVRDAVGRSRADSPFFAYLIDPIRSVIDNLTTFVQGLISQPAYDRPVPLIGWMGVVALATLAAYALASPRAAVLTCLGFLAFGALGLWQESMDTLALTLVAVFLSLLVGIPLGIWAGLSDRFNRMVTPVLDLMQTMPTFVYLAPLTLFFLIGPASAVIATLIYATPPTIRITAYGIRGVPEPALEASTSLGATRAQLLRKVRLPLAKRTIVLGINQTTMAALAMVTIAALIDAPGLGQTVVQALQTLDVGTAFNGGLAIVIMAIVLDRVTTAASERTELEYRTGPPASGPRRRLVLGALGVVAVIAAYLSYTYLWASEFPGTDEGGAIGPSVVDGANSASTWISDNLSGLTGGIKDAITAVLLNPLQSLLAESPWYLVCAVILGVTMVVAGPRAVVAAAVCLALLIGTGLWSDAMVTLATTLVATIIVMILGVTVGVWMGRSRRADRWIRPSLDAAQVMPPFVYLVPFLALFGPTRFTAIVAAVVYAAPVAIKVIADGIRGVSATAVEAAASCGSSTWQVIAKVQLPMARRALTLAANQGLIYVLAMVVVGGLVGAGALGYLVVAGFSQAQLFGKGLAAGVAIVLLGILLDRITQAAARRAGPPGRSTH